MTATDSPAPRQPRTPLRISAAIELASLAILQHALSFRVSAACSRCARWIKPSQLQIVRAAIYRSLATLLSWLPAAPGAAPPRRRQVGAEVPRPMPACPSAGSPPLHAAW
jgi:hypothetical protein